MLTVARAPIHVLQYPLQQAGGDNKAGPSADRAAFDRAVAQMADEPEDAIAGFTAILANTNAGAALQKLKESSIFKLCELYGRLQRAGELVKLLAGVRPFFENIAKAKTAKIVRTVINEVARCDGSDEMQFQLCTEYIEWCKKEKRTFLRQRIQSKLAQLHLAHAHFQPALKLLRELESEIKRLDDKMMLVEIFLTQSRVHHALRNVPRARSALTAARANANSIYVGPLLQAELDLQGGVLNAEDGDYRTGYSYLFEAFEGFTNLTDPRALLALKYMMLCKTMSGKLEDIEHILASKLALKISTRYNAPTSPRAGANKPDSPRKETLRRATKVGLGWSHIEAMKAVAGAYRSRSLHELDEVLARYRGELGDDTTVKAHLKTLETQLLEQNLQRIIEPYSRVEIAHVATLIALPEDKVEQKLSQMILDKKLHGTLDQGAGTLVLFEDVDADKTYGQAVECISNMGEVVEALFSRAQGLS